MIIIHIEIYSGPFCADTNKKCPKNIILEVDNPKFMILLDTSKLIFSL